MKRIIKKFCLTILFLLIAYYVGLKIIPIIINETFNHINTDSLTKKGTK